MPAISWFSPATGLVEKKLVIRILESNYLNDGQYTRLFEERIANLIGVKHCVGVTSGTAAIALALMGMGIGPGDEVIVPDLTFIATANAARLTGAWVRLVDIEPRRFTIDVESVVRNINARTKAIVPVDVNGRGADYGALESLARKKGLALICDSAEALGSKYQGRYLGSFGDAGCFSFSPNKTITTGQGGMVATNNTKLCHRLLELKDQGRRYQGTGGNDRHPVMGYNFKLTNLQAAVGLGQLKRLSRRLTKARQRDKWYQDLLVDRPDLTVVSRQNQSEEVAQWTDILVKDRTKVEAALTRGGIGYRPFWYPLHTQKPYLMNDKDFPNSLVVSSRGLWLPSHFDLTKKEVTCVSKVVMKSLDKNPK